MTKKPTPAAAFALDPAPTFDADARAANDRAFEADVPFSDDVNLSGPGSAIPSGPEQPEATDQPGADIAPSPEQAPPPEAAKAAPLTPFGLEALLNEIGRRTAGGTVDDDCRAFVLAEGGAFTDGPTATFTLAGVSRTSTHGMHRAALDWCMEVSRKLREVA